MKVVQEQWSYCPFIKRRNWFPLDFSVWQILKKSYFVTAHNIVPVFSWYMYMCILFPLLIFFTNIISFLILGARFQVERGWSVPHFRLFSLLQNEIDENLRLCRSVMGYNTSFIKSLIAFVSTCNRFHSVI